MYIEPTSLYMKDNKGAIRKWSIGVEDGVIKINHGQLNGSMQTQTEDIPAGKGGRSLEEQILSRVSSRIHKQRDKGYSPNIEDAKKRPMNALGLHKPMLAQPISKVKSINFSGASIQPKLDGNRMLITNCNGENIAYTRNGKRIETVDHILDSMIIPEGSTIDGEIYCHGQSLQTIVSWVKRKQDNTARLRYHSYDMINESLSFKDRLSLLSTYDLGERAEIVQTYNVRNEEQVWDIFRHFRNGGYEGAIVRTEGTGYETGKRSKSLIKIKEWLDDEYIVTGVSKSADGWAILECIMKNGNIFTVSAPGSVKEKIYVLENKQAFIGKPITVEYANLTKDGMPFHPVALRWRIDV